MAFFMGIDAGTSGIKAVILDDTGQIHGLGYCECDVITPNPGWAEQDPRDWWNSCRTAVKQAVTASGLGKEIKGIGFSGQMQGSTMLDKDGEPLGNCLLWLDQRAQKEADEINDLFEPEELYGITASKCLNSFWAPKLLWVRKHEPERFDKIRKVLFTKDYIAYKLTGEMAAEVSDASLSFLMNVHKRSWSDTMFKKLDIPEYFAPERLLESNEVVGGLLPSVAEELGLTPGIPVVAGGGDQPAGAVGTGIVRAGTVGASIGTSGVVIGCADRPFVDRNGNAIYSMAHSVPGLWAFLGLALSSGGSFKWLRQTFFQEKEAELNAKGQDIYDYMSALAAKASPGCEGLVFLPYLNGEKTPHNDENARGLFFGLSYRHDSAAICRAVMEGVTFSLRDSMETFRASGLVINQVIASGGGARSALWRQMQADIYGASVVTTNTVEGPAAGGAILAAVGAGYFKSVQEGADAIVRITSEVEPDPIRIVIYEDYYQTYRSLYPALRGIYAKQADIVAKYITSR